MALISRDVQVTIDGDDHTILIDKGTLSFENVLNGRSTAEFKMFDSKGGFRPTDGMPIEILELADDGFGPAGSVTVFGGLLRHPDEIEQGDNLRWKCQADSYDQLADRYYVYLGWTSEAQTLRARVVDIINNSWMSEEIAKGLTFAGVETGPQVRARAWAMERVSDVFNDLADETGLNWWIDSEKDLHFAAPTSTPASITLDSDTLSSTPKPTIRFNKTDYLNRAAVIGGTPFIHVSVQELAGEIAARSAIEDTAGVYMKRFDLPSARNGDECGAHALDMLARHGVMGIEFTGLTDQTVEDTPLDVGQEVTVNLPDQDANSVSMLIHKVVGTIHGSEIWRKIEAKGPTS